MGRAAVATALYECVTTVVRWCPDATEKARNRLRYLFHFSAQGQSLGVLVPELRHPSGYRLLKRHNETGSRPLTVSPELRVPRFVAFVSFRKPQQPALVIVVARNARWFRGGGGIRRFSPSAVAAHFL